MASVIVVDENFDRETDPNLVGTDFKNSLANGMKYFGLEVRVNGATDAGLLQAFRLMLHYQDGLADPRYPGYQVFAVLPGPVLISLTEPESSGQGIKFKTDTNPPTFFVDTKEDKSNRMNVALPIFPNPDAYLGQLIDIIENDLDNQEERDFLFANTLISRCK